MNSRDFPQLVDSMIRRSTSEWRQVLSGACPPASPEHPGHVDPVIALLSEVFSHNCLVRGRTEGPAPPGADEVNSDLLAPADEGHPGAAELDDLLAESGIVPPGADSIGALVCDTSLCYLNLNRLIENWDSRTSVSELNDLLSRFFSLKLRIGDLLDDANRTTAGPRWSGPSPQDGLAGCDSPGERRSLGAVAPAVPDWLY